MTGERPYRPPASTLSHEPQRERPLRSALIAIGSGLGIDFFGTQVASGVLMFTLGPALVSGDPTSDQFAYDLVRHPLWYWPMLAVGLFFVVFAGYMAGRLATHRPVFFAGLAGLSSLVPVLAILASTGFFESAAPRWFDQALVVFHVPIACLGGWLAGGRAAS